MKKFGDCNICGKYDRLDTHKCPPKWEAVVINPCGDDPSFPDRTAFGVDAETAVLDLAEENFSNWDCPDAIEIWVRATADSEWRKYEISVAPVPSFTVSIKT